jgi:transposase, IS6 family
VKNNSSPFKWRHFEPEIILLCVRWYFRYQLSYRDLEEMMRERGLSIDHTTIFRWVQKYAPEINKRIRPHLKLAGTSYRVDETYIKVGKSCKYLYRAVDSTGQTIEFMLSAKRDVSAAKRFFKKMMRADHRRLPFTISVDKNAAYPEAFTTSQNEQVLPQDCKLRRVKYLNNIIEQDHRFIKKSVRACLGYRSFDTAERTLQGVEAVNMIRKGQVKRLVGNDAIGQAKFVASLFQIAAEKESPVPRCVWLYFSQHCPAKLLAFVFGQSDFCKRSIVTDNSAPIASRNCLLVTEDAHRTRHAQ